MIGRVDEVVVDCTDPLGLAEFWARVLGGQACRRDADWCYVDPPGWTRLAFQRVPEAKQTKNRLHIDVEVVDTAAATAAAERLGATPVGEAYVGRVGSFQVLLDPDGNEWCVVRSASPG